MMTNQKLSLPKWFWVISILAMLWNLMGVVAYLGDASSGMQAPSWAIAAYAIAVFSGLLASIFLLLKKNIATAFFALSLIGVLAQQYYFYAVSDSIKNVPALSALIVIVAIFLLWFSRSCASKGWLR